MLAAKLLVVAIAIALPLLGEAIGLASFAVPRRDMPLLLLACLTRLRLVILPAHRAPAHEHPAGHPQDGAARQGRGDHEDGGQPGVAGFERGAVEQRLAEEQGDDRDRRQHQASDREQHAGCRHVATFAVEVELVHGREAVKEDAGEHE